MLTIEQKDYVLPIRLIIFHLVRKLSAVFVLVGIACAQVYIPTGVSTQSGIVRNVPTQIVRIPADTYINDGRQTYLAAQVPLQLFNNRGQNNNNLYTTNTNTNNNRQFQTLNVREENLRRLIESEARLRDLLLLADQDNENNNGNNNYNTNYNHNNQNNQNNNKNNNRFTTTDTFGTTQDQTLTDNTNDNTNFNRNTHQGTLLTRDQLRTLVSTTNRDTGDLTQQYRTNTDTTGLHRLRDNTLLGRL